MKVDIAEEIGEALAELGGAMGDLSAGDLDRAEEALRCAAALVEAAADKLKQSREEPRSGSGSEGE